MKERYQNPVLNDEVRLRLFSYNSNNRANVSSIEKVEIYYLDPQERTESNPDGRRLVQTVDGNDITEEEVGLYSFIITAESEVYNIGDYIDVWHVTVQTESTAIENTFQIMPDLWFTSTTPIIYDFNFAFRPNRLRRGSKRWLMIEISPNVPSKSDLFSYYTNLAIVSPVKIFISKNCGDCVPVEEDLRLVVDGEDVELREKCLAYYFIDTTDMDLGIYDVWFEMELGESLYISEKQQLQVH